MVSGIDEIIESLSKDLKDRVDKVVELTELLEDTQSRLEVAKRDLNRVHIALSALNGTTVPIALEALNGSSIPVPITSPYQDSPTSTPSNNVQPIEVQAVPRPEPVSAPTRTGPVCTSCGSGIMIYTSRTLNNGKTVTLWLCPECRNERF